MNNLPFFQSNAWQYLIGHTTISAKQRIFNLVCVFSLAGIMVSIFFNGLFNLVDLALIQSGFLALQVFVYYLSRVRKQYDVAFMIYAIANYLFLSATFIYNGGLMGPALLVFFVSFHCLAAISPHKMVMLWAVLHMATVALLCAFQYFFPELVQMTYSSTADQFTDVSITFCICVLITYFITISVRNRFHQERLKVASQKAIIEDKNRQLQYVDNERNRLFSIIAHDLRSPLTTIHGYLDLLTSGVLQEEERNETEKQLLNLSTHTSEMLNNLLYWSKSQLQKNSVLLEPLSVAQVFKNTIEVQKSIAEKKGVRLLIEIPETLTMHANKDLTDVVIRNLLSNAIKFTRHGGAVEMTATIENDAAFIYIKDNGVGIHDSQKPYIFHSEIKPLTGTDNEKGIGLGLVMCKEFVEKQGGEISFYSEENVGTSFIVKLPQRKS